MNIKLRHVTSTCIPSILIIELFEQGFTKESIVNFYAGQMNVTKKESWQIVNRILYEDYMAKLKKGRV